MGATVGADFLAAGMINWVDLMRDMSESVAAER